MSKSIQLLENLRIEIGHSCQVREGAEAWRVIINFISDYPDKNRIVKEYFVWVTGEYLRDKESVEPDIMVAENFALEVTKKRFIESGNQTPVENGISCSRFENVVIVNPKTYIHPMEQKL